MIKSQKLHIKVQTLIHREFLTPQVTPQVSLIEKGRVIRGLK